MLSLTVRHYLHSAAKPSTTWSLYDAKYRRYKKAKSDSPNVLPYTKCYRKGEEFFSSFFHCMPIHNAAVTPNLTMRPRLFCLCFKSLEAHNRPYTLLPRLSAVTWQLILQERIENHITSAIVVGRFHTVARRLSVHEIR